MQQSKFPEHKVLQIAPRDLIDAAQALPGAAALIDQLRGGAARRLPIATVSMWIDALIRGLPYFGYYLPADVMVFRGRIWPEQLQLANDFSYRPVSKNCSAGRCNHAGASIFYGALNLDTVFSELHPDVGDTIQVGLTRPKTSGKLSVSAIGEIDHIRRFDAPLVGNGTTKAHLNEFMSQLREDEKARVLLVDAFFADLFQQPAVSSHDYKASISLASNLLQAVVENREVLDGFLYPSVAHRGGMNIVIQPAAFDKNMEWQRFETYKITESLGYGLYRRVLVADGNLIADGAIQWVGRC